MTRKTIYLIPAFAAVFALMFAFAPSIAMAEPGEWSGQNKQKMHKIVEIDGFVGSIQVTEDTDKRTLRDQITVTKRDIAVGSDVDNIRIGFAVNEDGAKFLVWILTSINENSETVTIHVIDAGDSSNTATITKVLDASTQGNSKNNGAKRASMLEKIIQRLSEPTGNAEIDALRVAAVDILQQMQAALEGGDSEQFAELRQEFKDLKSELRSQSSQV